MKKKIFLLLTSSSFFIVFVVFSFLVHKNLFKHFDFNTTVRIQDRVSPRFDEVFSIFSLIGGFEIATIFLIILLALIVLTRGGGLIPRLFRISSVLAAYAGFHLIEIYGKVFVNHLPPPEFMLRTERLVDFPQFHVRTENSYPSGHSGRALFISVILFFFIFRSKKLPKEAKLIIFSLLFIYDLTMLVSRIYLGEHWTSDVIGGSMLGTALGVLGSLILVF